MTFLGVWAACSVAFVLGLVIGFCCERCLRDADLEAARHVARRDHLELARLR